MLIDFLVVSSDLWLYVLDTCAKRRIELSSKNYHVVNWIRECDKLTDRPSKVSVVKCVEMCSEEEVELELHPKDMESDMKSE